MLRKRRAAGVGVAAIVGVVVVAGVVLGAALTTGRNGTPHATVSAPDKRLRPVLIALRGTTDANSYAFTYTTTFQPGSEPGATFVPRRPPAATVSSTSIPL